jgi:hypothetical protein
MNRRPLTAAIMVALFGSPPSVNPALRFLDIVQQFDYLAEPSNTCIAAANPPPRRESITVSELRTMAQALWYGVDLAPEHDRTAYARRWTDDDGVWWEELSCPTMIWPWLRVLR